MKRLSLLLVMIFILGLMVPMLNASEVTIGAGDQTGRIPVDMFYKNSLFECLYYQDELLIVNGSITGVAFYNNFSSNLPGMPINIWLGITTQTDLSGGWIPSTQLTQVFTGNVDFPSGTNTINITFTTPFQYSGGVLVMMVERVMDSTWHSSSDLFACQTIGTNRALNIFSDSVDYDPANPPTGTTASGKFPKTTFFYTGQGIGNDLACLSITGNTTPSVGQSYQYVVTVKNNGQNAQNTYTVKLMQTGDVELASLPGLPINEAQTLTYTFNWTPSVAGPTTLYGKVVLATDEIPSNNQSPALSIAVQPAGIQAVTIADGTATMRIPMDFYYKNSLSETIYLSDELGFVSGTITSLAFYNNFFDSPSNGATKIWLGSTNVQDLSGGWIPSTQMTLVFDGNITYPSGINTITIPLQTPYMHTPGNLVMMVQRPMDTQYYSSSDNFYGLTIGTNRTLKVQSDGTAYDPANPPAGTTPVGQVPKTTIFYTEQQIVNDLSCLTITGSGTPNVNSTATYTITVKNNGTATQTNYTVKLMKEGGVQLATAAGTSIASLETASFNLSWTPTTVETTYLYGVVELAGDEIATNNQTGNLTVQVMEAGLTVVQIGQGTATNSTTGTPTPYGTFYKNFRQQYLYKADDIYAAGGAPGLITALAFNVTSVNNCSPMPNYTIKVKHTDQTQLTTTFEIGEYTTVWNSASYLPTAGWNIHTFTTPFFWNGASNLLIDICTDLITGDWTENASVPYTPTSYPSCLRFQNDTQPASAATTGTTSTNRANARLFMTISDMGSLTGVVSSSGAPLEGASVTVVGTVFHTLSTADGSYNFPYVPIGTQQVMATKHGYNEVTHTVTIVEDQTTTQNFELTLLPQVTVSGRIVGSDQPTVGLAGATIALSGYEPYEATTNATGNFTIPNVFANQTYNYVATATGYQPATGQVVVGTTNVNMGDITVNELAFPPYGVVAEEAANFTNVTVTWQPPNPNAQTITEGFEGTTFPPTDWSQIITDTSAPGTTGVYPTWCQVGTIALTPAVPPHGGSYQAAMWWSYNHQDEWLITPQFSCPGNAVLQFWSYVYLGSTNNDHYYIKVSTDNGNTWTVLWDATALTGGWNYYATPITIDLSSYTGQQIKLAWHADDPPSADGMWYVWFVDDILIGTPDNVLKFSTEELLAASKVNNSTPKMVYPSLPISRDRIKNPAISEPVLSVERPTENNRVLLGYRVYRLLAADQGNEANWTTLTPSTITPTTYVDNAWQPLPSGVYKFAVKAVYTNNVFSNAAFSNEIHKGMMGTLTGTVTEFGTNLPIQGATITAGEYSGQSDATGHYSFGVYAGTYTVTCTKQGYQSGSQAGVVITGMQTTTQNFVLTEITLPPVNVQATDNGAIANITWMAPGSAGGEWLHYDSGENNDSIGTGSANDFDVYIRYPASALADYAGMSLYTLKVWPAQAGTFSVRVWTGGTAAAPANMVVDQGFTPVLDTYNTVTLNNPVLVTGNEELWFGYRNVVTSGYPAGCDAGPAVNGFGNMMYFGGSWTTLIEQNPDLDYNWNIQGFVGWAAPTAAPSFEGIRTVLQRTKSLPQGMAKSISHNNETVQSIKSTDDRVLVGYQVWRLLQGQETNENAWTLLTGTPITALSFADEGWASLPDGTYKWAVKAVYTGGAYSVAALSNALPLYHEIGTIAGIVRNMQNQPISGATVTCEDVTATTNASGAYSMTVLSGVHSVTASHPNYASVTHSGIIVVTGQTTTVNFQLPPTSDLFSDGFETYPDFTLTFAPWTLVDVDLSGTYGIQGYAWENAYSPMAFIIFNPTATTPPLTSLTAHGGNKMACSFASTTPPNNDWMITPQLSGASSIKFWARSYVDDYGLERFKVGISNNTTPGSFTIISGPNYIQAPVEWTEYTYQITQPGPLYIGIQCLSNDAFFFCVDDVTVAGNDVNDPEVPVVATALHNNYPNPFNPETTISYSVKDREPVTLEIYNIKGQLVKTLVKGIQEPGNHTIVWNGTDDNGRSVSSGVYYYKMQAGKYSSTKKMIMMK